MGCHSYLHHNKDITHETFIMAEESGEDVESLNTLVDKLAEVSESVVVLVSEVSNVK